MRVITSVHTRSRGFQLALIKGSLLNPPVPALGLQQAVKYKPCTSLLEENADACSVVASL